MPYIYQPAEDSYLMQSMLKKEIPNLLKINTNLRILEIGAGSGIHLETLFKLGIKKENIFSIDVDDKSVNHCRSLGFNCIQSDLFSNVKEKFDLIFFNPPYLPEDSREPEDSRLATTGGKYGSEIINKFLTDAKNHLNKNGKIFLLTSSLTKKINWQNLKKKKIAEEKLFFEKLFIWELTASVTA